MGNHMYCEVWDEFTYPFRNVNGAAVHVISPHSNKWLLIQAGIKAKPYYYSGPGGLIALSFR